MAKFTYHPNEDIFESQAEALVNPVNCRGAMGAGLARKFKYRFPSIDAPYRNLCEREFLFPGRAMYVPTLNKIIVLFPTKDDWRKPARMAYITEGMNDLAALMDGNLSAVRSIAIPQLGCGLGGLVWKDVCPVIVRALEPVADLRVEIYGPSVPETV